MASLTVLLQDRKNILIKSNERGRRRILLHGRQHRNGQTHQSQNYRDNEKPFHGASGTNCRSKTQTLASEFLHEPRLQFVGLVITSLCPVSWGALAVLIECPAVWM